MLFNSLEFAVFLPIVFAAYWLLGPQRRTAQNVLLLVASYFFYGWWDYRFLALIAASTLLDYLVGVGLSKTDSVGRRRLLLALSLLLNLGSLAFFKYYNFFAESFVDAFRLFGQSFELERLNIILPVGISFYTFQTLSYTIDVYRRQIPASRDPIAFAAFVSFFPQLVAGPIERAANLLPQFYVQRRFDYAWAVDGSRQMLLGLFKKVVIADNCAVYVNRVFDAPGTWDPWSLSLGVFLFAFQIYGDFSGYSDVAIGSARLFGLQLSQNFRYPYFARDIAEFWRRWHISLSSWFRDYVYIPLGGNRGGLGLTLRNVLIVFLLCGAWHGANWTFIVWGALHAVYYVPLLLAGVHRRYVEHQEGRPSLPSTGEALRILSTFLLVLIAWVFFRAASVGEAIEYLQLTVLGDWLQPPQLLTYRLAVVLGLIGALVSLEWFQQHLEHAFAIDDLLRKKWQRWSFYGMVTAAIFCLGGKQADFIYFQF